ncbi:MAG: PorP/SprF family type IX secretion system membrane protein, partial [Cyclobacteriaceae bacterium]|nr:PorP/SprF family type IX secretion system membrane protein [Cyclobacteriaceae bacterium]
MIVNRENIARTFTHPKIGCWLALVLFSITNSYGQQAIQFSQYFSNQLVINPAFAGSEDALSITMVHRNQWTGINGAPTTTTLSGHTLFKNEHTGLGVNMFVDKINIHKSSNFLGLYSYRIKVSNSSYLSMGLQAGVENIKSDY